MAVSLTTPVTGGLQTGMTTPAWTVVADNPPNASTGKQWNVSALASGSAASVRFHTISDPFTVLFERPGFFKTLAGLISGLTGLYGKVPDNIYRVKARKGVMIAANNLPRVMEIDARVAVPAGADAYDSPNVRACVSLFIGAMNQVSAGYGDTLVTGTQ